jgi:hypothetical protein
MQGSAYWALFRRRIHAKRQHAAAAVARVAGSGVPVTAPPDTCVMLIVTPEKESICESPEKKLAEVVE